RPRPLMRSTASSMSWSGPAAIHNSGPSAATRSWRFPIEREEYEAAMASSLRSVDTLALFLFALAALQWSSASAQDVKQQVATCAACHPMSAVPANSPNPIIWGQNEGYVYVQLRDFKRATRASPSCTL